MLNHSKKTATVNCTAVSSESILAELKKNGWEERSLGYYRSNGSIKPKTGFIYVRRQRYLKDIIRTYTKKSRGAISANACNTGVSESGSNHTMGLGGHYLTPEDFTNAPEPVIDIIDDNDPMKSLSSFGDYVSLTGIQSNDPCLVIGFKSIRECLDNGGDVLSWHFSLINDLDLIEYSFIRTKEGILHLGDVLGYILDDLAIYDPIDKSSIRRYEYCPEWKDSKPVIISTSDINEACKLGKYLYRNEVGFTRDLIIDDAGKSSNDGEWYHAFDDFNLISRIPICLVCCNGTGDLCSLDYGKKSILRHLSNINGNLSSIKPIYYSCRSIQKYNHHYIYNLSLSIVDTVCHCPSDKNSVDDLYDVLNLNKASIPEIFMSNMSSLFMTDPVKYLEYGTAISLVSLLYMSSIYGVNRTMPVTMISATAHIIKSYLMDYYGCETESEYDKKYRGLEKITKKRKAGNGPSYFVDTKPIPISSDAKIVQDFATEAYHGGYNTCPKVGCFQNTTFDLDAKNAYPTVMCLLPGIEWSNPIKYEITRRQLTINDFNGVDGINPLLPFVGYVRFRFPDNVKYPCLPINVDNCLVYPLSSDGLNGVYAAGPLVWLALTLGATVYCDRGFILNTIPNSYPFREPIKHFVADRDMAKIKHGKGSIEDLVLKTMVNAIYGKVSQGVVDKAAWNAYKDSMENLGISAITNPVSAMMITSIVQAILIAAQNQLNNMGYDSYSVTTDGMITNCPEAKIEDLDLYGLKPFINDARLFLTNGTSSKMWEEKHRQDDLINFTTRGNVSLHKKERDGYDGVCAHNSAKSNYEPDSYEDRLWLMTQVLSRTGSIQCKIKKRTSFRDLVKGMPFAVWDAIEFVRMDYDMKRKPLKESFHTDLVTVEGKDYELAHFDTMPFNDVAEYKLYRDKKDLVPVLRTETDWYKFWNKLETSNTTAKPRDLEWSILYSCIVGHRADLWHIPGLETGTVAEKCAWINAHNTSQKVFKETDWKNARKPERRSSMLPIEIINEKLDELMSAD